MKPLSQLLWRNRRTETNVPSAGEGRVVTRSDDLIRRPYAGKKSRRTHHHPWR